MRCVFPLSVSFAVVVLAGCGQSFVDRQADKMAEALAVDPVRLKALRAQCAAERQATGENLCRAAADAFRRRLFAGEAGADEYLSLSDLPVVPLPPSGPAAAPASPAAPVSPAPSIPSVPPVVTEPGDGGATAAILGRRRTL